MASVLSVVALVIAVLVYLQGKSYKKQGMVHYREAIATLLVVKAQINEAKKTQRDTRELLNTIRHLPGGSK